MLMVTNQLQTGWMGVNNNEKNYLSHIGELNGKLQLPIVHLAFQKLLFSILNAINLLLQNHKLKNLLCVFYHHTIISPSICQPLF